VQRLIVQSAALPPLLLLVQADFSDSVLAAAQAICALCDLADARDALREMRGFGSIVALLGKGAENDAAGVAADTVAKLADADDVNRNWLREARDAIPSMPLRSCADWSSLRIFSMSIDPRYLLTPEIPLTRRAQSFRSSRCSARDRRAQGRPRRRAHLGGWRETQPTRRGSGRLAALRVSLQWSTQEKRRRCWKIAQRQRRVGRFLHKSRFVRRMTKRKKEIVAVERRARALACLQNKKKRNLLLLIRNEYY
jgi:hypothetical protein